VHLNTVYIKNYSELYDSINKGLKKLKPQVGEDFTSLLKRKVNYTYTTIRSELVKIMRVLYELRSSGKFYLELYRVFAGEDINVLEEKAKRSIKQLRSIYRNITAQLNSSRRGDDVASVARTSIARLLSVYKRINRRVLKLRDFLAEINKMPDIRGDYIVLIAGLPQVGKSTLLSKLTSAKPEIGFYPFTTKTLIAGHINVDYYGKIVLLDSPGVLDSPIEEKSVVEYKTILALKHLAHHMLYVFDFTENFYYTPREQFNVYFSLRRVLGDKPITLVLNKIDQLTEDQLRRAVEAISKITGLEPIPVSALLGLNLERVKSVLTEYFMKRYPHSSQ
jgi:nucleolar GTP-binding protein